MEVTQKMWKLLEIGIRHGDYHTENIMFDYRGEAFIIDYGRAYEAQIQESRKGIYLNEDFYDIFGNDDDMYKDDWEVSSYAMALESARKVVPGIKSLL